MSIYNLGTVFMMAYAFLVIPKESIEKNKTEVSSNDINAILNKIRIECNENNVANGSFAFPHILLLVDK